MTAPLATEQTDGQPNYTHAEEAAIALLALYLGSSDAVTAALLPERLVVTLTALGLQRRAVVAAGRLAMAPPLSGRGRYGSPSPDSSTTTMVRTVKAEEPLMRARYVLNAAKRLSKALLAGGSGLFPAALRVEATYMDQQRYAGQNRAKAAASYDRAAALAGPDGKLRWNAQHDGRVTPDCAALDGTLFAAGEPPHGLLPGAVHARCRCFATPSYDAFTAQPQLFASAWAV